MSRDLSFLSSSPRRCTRRRLLRAGGTVAAATSLGGCVLSTEPYTETADRSFDPGDAGSLAVVTRNGDVTLSPGDGDAVTGTVTKESRSGEDALAEVSVETTTTDGTFRIETQYPDRSLNVAVHLDLEVPDGVAVAEARTRNGDVSLTDVAGDATCESRNGAVEVDGVDGYVTLRSTNGDVTARDPTGVGEAATTNGSVDVDVPALRGDATCVSTNGDVRAAVPDDLNATVELSTVNGDASSAVGLADRETSDTRIEGVLGDGEHALTLETTNGDVTLAAL